MTGPLALGRVVLDVPFFQGPVSGYTSYPTRKLALDFGSPVVWSGVLLASSVVDRGVLRRGLFAPGQDEHPIGAQILWHEPSLAAKAAMTLVGQGYDLIDLNFACPAPKVLRRHRGGALLTYPSMVVEIYKAVRDAVQCPVLMKLRIGFDGSDCSRDCLWEIIERAHAYGIDGITIHGRTVQQRYGGRADWQTIAEVKQRFPALVVMGSGDLFDVRTALARLKESGVDGLAIARGAMGNPWLLRDLRAALEGRQVPDPPTLQEQREIILWHFCKVLDLYHPEYRAVGYFRKFLVGYLKRHTFRRQALPSLLAAKTSEAVIAGIRHWFSEDRFDPAL